jgi:hypothetical protein
VGVRHFFLDRWVVTGDQNQRGSLLRSRQFGRTSAPTIPHFVHTIGGPKDGTGTSSGHGSALKIARCLNSVMAGFAWHRRAP